MKEIKAIIQPAMLSRVMGCMSPKDLCDRIVFASMDTRSAKVL